jgi:hypothetical protein
LRVSDEPLERYSLRLKSERRSRFLIVALSDGEPVPTSPESALEAGAELNKKDAARMSEVGFEGLAASQMACCGAGPVFPSAYLEAFQSRIRGCPPPMTLPATRRLVPE